MLVIQKKISHNSSDEYMRDNWFPIATNDLLFKLLICYLAFLPFYGLLLNFILSNLRKKYFPKKN